MIVDPPRKPLEAISRMPECYQVIFRLDNERMGSVDAWQIARLLPLSIGRYPAADKYRSRKRLLLEVSSWDL